MGSKVSPAAVVNGLDVAVGLVGVLDGPLVADSLGMDVDVRVDLGSGELTGADSDSTGIRVGVASLERVVGVGEGLFASLRFTPWASRVRAIMVGRILVGKSATGSVGTSPEQALSVLVNNKEIRIQSLFMLFIRS